MIDKIEWYRFGQKKGSLLAREIAIQKIFVEKLSNKIEYFDYIINNYKYVNWTHYIAKKDLNIIIKEFIKKLDKVNNLRILTKQANKTYVEVKDEIKKFSLDNKTPNKELLNYFDFSVHYLGLIERYLPCANFIVRVLSWEIEKKLQKLFPSKTEEELKQIAMVLSYNEKESVFLERHKALLELAKSYGDDQLEKHRIKQFIKKFDWMNIMFLIYKPSSSLEIENELRIIKDPQKELINIKLIKEENIQKREELLHKIKPKRELMHIIDLLKISSYAETEILKCFQQVEYLFYPLLSCIAKRLGLEYNQLIYCSINEIKESLENKMIVPSSDILNKRDKKGFSCFLSDGKLNISFEEEHKEDYKKIISIKGMCASPGKVKGRARIIFDINEAGKLKKGDILITGMTTPNLVTIMQKAGAIVTNDGGILCHAAIVSRELKKPCIVGTRIATEILKDGDLIEVDAQHGIVRILKRFKK